MSVTLPMKIKCVAPFAGGKRRLAARIVDLLGPHDAYVEPFVGGCAILPRKPPCREEVVSDANPAVACVLNALRFAGADVSALLGARDFCQREYDISSGFVAAGVRDRDLGFRHDATFAAHQLCVWWMGAGGIAGTTRKGWFARRHSKTGGDPAVRWDSFRASLPALRERLKGVEVNCYDWRAFFRDYQPDGVGVAYYVDPPYLEKSFRYAADFAGNDHVALAASLNALRKARVVVSYYDDGKGTLARLYPPDRWRRIDVEVSKNMSAVGGTTARAVEVLLVNDTSEVG